MPGRSSTTGCGGAASGPVSWTPYSRAASAASARASAATPAEKSARRGWGSACWSVGRPVRASVGERASIEQPSDPGIVEEALHAVAGGDEDLAVLDRQRDDDAAVLAAAPDAPALAGAHRQLLDRLVDQARHRDDDDGDVRLREQL